MSQRVSAAKAVAAAVAAKEAAAAGEEDAEDADEDGDGKATAQEHGDDEHAGPAWDDLGDDERSARPAKALSRLGLC